MRRTSAFHTPAGRSPAGPAWLDAPDGAARILDGLTVTISGDPCPASAVALRHLKLLGAAVRQGAGAIGDDHHGRLSAALLSLTADTGAAGQHPLDDGDHIACTLGWWSGAPAGAGSAARADAAAPIGAEAIAQAVSGLMEVHGRDGGRPRRLGLNVASTAAGVLAVQGMLATLIGRSRGRRISDCATSVTQGALLYLCHHLAYRTSAEQWSPPPAEPAPGPPFPTVDGAWVEIEALSPAVWASFWAALGLPEADAARSWLAFALRYTTGRCSLPAVLHETSSRHTVAELTAAAETAGTALTRVRNYEEVLAALRSGAGPARSILVVPPPWRIREAGAETASGRPAQGRWRTPAAGSDWSPAAGGLPADLPLDGLRVVEVTTRLQGPLAGLLLRMLGAEVTRVEPPGGDFGRFVPPLAAGQGAFFLAYNRGKHGVEIDYRQPEGRAELFRLVSEADVFLHNWPAGRAEELGLAHADVAVGNPELVYCHASGWGDETAGLPRIGADYLVQAHAGCGDGLNPVGTPPHPSRLTLTDVLGALLACEGILAGLYQRERTGQGCRVDTGLLAGAMALQAPVLEAMNRRHEPGRHRGRPLWGPLDEPIQTIEGDLILSLENEGMLERLLDICGLSESDTPPAPNGARPSLEAAALLELQGRPAAAWAQLLTAAGIPAAVVLADLAHLPDDPRFEGLLECLDESCHVPAPPWSFSP